MAKGKKEKNKEPEKMGRPTDYDPIYCEMLVKHMESGLSFESFAAIADTTRKTIYNWLQQFPDFLHAKEKATEKSRHYWEKVGRDGLYHETIKTDDGMTINRSINAAIWIFNVKNRFGWRDKQPDEEPGNPSAPQADQHPAMTREEAKKLIDKARTEKKPGKPE